MTTPQQRKKNNLYFSLILIPIFLRVLTPVVFKMAAIEMPEYNLIAIATNYLYWLSLVIFGLRALTWQIVLRHFPLSLVYPLTSISFVFLLLTGYFFFNEDVRPTHIIGTVFIIVGSIIITQEKDQHA